MGRSKTDLVLLFATRITRLFAYGLLVVVLALYLAEIELGEARIGLLFSLTLAGDAAITLWITTSADRVGRRRMLILGAGLMAFAGLVFTLTQNFALMLVAAVIGVISPSGYEIGPFLSIEQASLAQIVPDRQRTQVYAWYNLVGSFATALGSLCAGALAQWMQASGTSAIDSYRGILGGYALAGGLLAACFLGLSPAIEASASEPTLSARRRFGLHRSRRTVLRLSGLFALDAFAGGLVVQAILAYWFRVRFGVEPAVLGQIIFGANLLAGVSALLAARLAARFGLINTMVYTHIPSNILLCMVPLMPTLTAAVAVFLLRFSISQMDVPTRQSYTMAVVDPDERSAASGVTTIARSVGASFSPALSGLILAVPGLYGLPFFLAGGLKIVYDLLLYRGFKAIKPPEEISTG
jgi:MFS family permease